MSAGDLAADYAIAGYGTPLPMGERPALLIVDVCQAYLDPASPLYVGGEAALAGNVRLVDAARARAIPIVFTRVVYCPGREGGLFYSRVAGLKCFDEGSPLGEFPYGLRSQTQDRVTEKQYLSGFFGTGLADSLDGDGVDTLFVTGYSTSSCVRATALDAMCHGFVPVVVADACADRDDRPHTANLFDLAQKYAEVIDVDEAIARLSRFTVSSRL